MKITGGKARALVEGFLYQAEAGPAAVLGGTVPFGACQLLWDLEKGVEALPVLLMPVTYRLLMSTLDFTVRRIQG